MIGCGCTEDHTSSVSGYDSVSIQQLSVKMKRKAEPHTRYLDIKRGC